MVSSLKRLLLPLLMAIAGSPAWAQSFQIDPTQVDIVAAPGFNHANVHVPITGTAGGFDFGTLSASSDASWVSATVGNAKVVLTFQTAGLVAGQNTATITVSGNNTTDTFFVRAAVAPLKVTKLEDDPARSRVYGLHQDGLNRGAVVVLDPITNTKVANVTVGRKPGDLAVSADGSELLVINCVDETLTAIDLATLRVKETITLPQFDNWGAESTTADVAYGPGSKIYYTDGSWAPVLRVFDRTTQQVTQGVLHDGYGFGDFALAPDGSALFGWIQYGWSAGWAGSYVVKYTVDAQGQLTFAQRTNNTYPTVLNRDPLDTPVFIDADYEHVFVKQLAVNPASVTDTKRVFAKPIYALSAGGEIAATDAAVYQVSTGINVLDLPVTTTVQTITSDYARLVYFDGVNRTFGSIDLLAAIGPAILNRNISPPDGSITLAPTVLEWSPLPGVDRYHVYLGQSETAVADATTSSPQYRGEATGPSFPVTIGLNAGTQYFWRIDAVTASGVVKGSIYDFTVSLIGTDVSVIRASTVAGHADHRVAVQLTSANPGLAWQATASQPWVTFANATGATPSALTVILNAAGLAPGTHTAEISVALTSGAQAPFKLPVTLEVEPLAITAMESDRASGLVYAISEYIPAGTSGRAYLLEIDSVAKAIRRVVRVGSSATDLAVHNADGRVYVANWLPGSLLAIDRTTFQQVRAYGFSAFQGTGYGDNDVFRIAAGVQGRLVVEEEDQWVDISIFDTVNGTMLGEAYVREGGGEFGPGGRFYYHGENNSSGAEIRKYDVTGDVFTASGHTRVSSYSYYGSRTVVVSENGERVFWNGAVFDENLAVEWLIGPEIYSTSPDGRFAFGNQSIYDVDLQQAVLAMPVNTRVSAYNSTSSRLVVQVGSAVKFYDLSATVELPAPTLTTTVIDDDSIELHWTDESLETGFTLQYRVAGTGQWLDLQVPLGANATSYILSGLERGTTYEFRIKADSPYHSSGWSVLASATTSGNPPPPPPPPGTSKLVYRRSGALRQMGGGEETNWVISGFFVWVPETTDAAHLILLKNGAQRTYYVVRTTENPIILTGHNDREIFAFAMASQTGPVELEASLMKGVARTISVGNRNFVAPPSLSGNTWGIGLNANEDSFLAQFNETCVLDVAASAASNASGETVDDVIERITRRWEDSGAVELSR